MKPVIIALSCILTLNILAQEWKVKASIPAYGRDDAIAFSINNIGYWVTGNHGGFSGSNLMFKYSIVSNSWSAATTFPGVPRQYTTTFVINNKAYIICGSSSEGNTLSDVWQFDPVSEEWTQKNDFPGESRSAAVSFSIANKGYFGLGDNGDNYKRDFWEYYPELDQWVKLSEFPGEERRDAVGFSAGGFGFIGTGSVYDNGILPTKDFYRFNPNTNSWQQISDYPGGLRTYAKSESWLNNGIVGSGMESITAFKSDFWMLDANSLEWTALPDIPVDGVRGCSSFSLGNKVYWVSGLTQAYEKFNGLFELSLETIKPKAYKLKILHNSFNNSVTLSCNAYMQTINIYNLEGKKEFVAKTTSTTFLIENLKTGIHLIRVELETGDIIERKFVIE